MKKHKPAPSGKPKHIATTCVHGGKTSEQPIPLSPPIYQTSAFRFADADAGERMIAYGEEGYAYTRIANPTQRTLERQMALLEEGEDAVAFASGMAAIAGIVFSVAKMGENIVASRILYGGTHKFLSEQLPRLGIEVRVAEGENPKNFENLIDKKTRLILFETPINPTLSLIDIEELAKIADRRKVLLAVDNTFATPCLQQPLKLGAHISVHSASKYISGHGDVIAGVAVARDKDFALTMRGGVLRDMGASLDPFAAWLLLRGLKTLAVRMERHSKNATAIAEFLTKHPKVSRVNYPGLSSHPQHSLAKRQMKDFGGMLSFEIKGDAKAAKRVVNASKLFAITATLGDCESIITHPASTTHSSYSKKECAKIGISEGLLRLSVGIEDAEDLKEDLAQALKTV